MPKINHMLHYLFNLWFNASMPKRRAPPAERMEKSMESTVKPKSKTLKEQGSRFYVSPDKSEARWAHPIDCLPNSANPAGLYVGWTDATDFTDEQFDLFMGVVPA